MDFSQSLDEIVNRDFDKSKDGEIDFIISEDGNMYNSAVFMVKNSEWGRTFLNNSIDLLAAPMPYSFQHNQWHEQSPFMYLSMVPSLLNINTLTPEV